MPAPPASRPADLRAALREHFGFGGLRPGQEAALRPVLEGRDALVVMPTGAGKSLVYQLAALLQPTGVTVVVSPLIALMKDQVDALRARGVAAAYVNSSQTQAEQRDVFEAIRAGHLKLVYAAPERLRLASFQARLREVGVSLLAVDEAHCVSQWGHDFRPDYLALADARAGLGDPPCVALTATATPRVQDDIAEQLKLHDPDRLVTGFNRPNLLFEVRSTATATEKRQALRRFLAEHDGDAGLIYVSTRKEADSLARFVRDEVRRPCETYHAGLADAERADVQERFVGGDLGLVVATNAFGMGVDRADVRFVAHWSLPPNLESYYQEAGRAGRDGRPATAVLFYAPRDRQLREWFIEQQAPTQGEMRAVFDTVDRLLRVRSANRGEIDLAQANPAHPDRLLEEQLVESVGVHGSKAKVILSLLRRAGALIERDGRAGLDRWVRGTWDDGRVRQTLGRTDAHRDGKTADLGGIVGYAEATACRRRAILDHFGDDTVLDVAPEACCDTCRVRSRLRDAPDEIPDWDALPMASRVALGLLDAVRRLRWPVGRVTLAKILAGSKAKGMDRYEGHPYYGRLQTLGQDAVDGIYKQLLLKDYLRIATREAPGGQTFQVVALAPLGEQALDHREAIDVDVPAFGAARSASAAGGTARAARPTGEGDVDPATQVRFERLRQWRTDEARDRAVPPYVVFNDRTLLALAAARPSTEADLLAVKGVGPAKAEAYGADLLRLLADG